jgi:hypothetical protein
MRKKIIIVLCMIISISAKTQVVPTQAWIKYYSSTDTVENVATALDANNNVYITGHIKTSPTNYDLIVQKRDSLGTLLWTYTYNNSTIEKGKAIKVDASGNVYVTGESNGAGGGRDAITIKLNASGVSQWLTRFNNFSTGTDDGVDIDIDATGNVYITGSCNNSSGNQDIYVIKYNSSGTQQWKTLYDGTGHIGDKGVALAVTSNGNDVYVTGIGDQNGSNSYIVTQKLSGSSGAVSWTTVKNGTANGNDKPYAISIVGSNIAVCGEIKNTTTNLDYITEVYHGSSGSVAWSDTYDYGNLDNSATDIVKDSAGNLAVTGIALNGSIYEYHTAFYNTSGTRQWVNKESLNMNGVAVVPHVVCDTIAHHFYICGEYWRTSKDIMVYQIAPSGNTKWKKIIDGSNGDSDSPVSLVVNGVGVVYVAALCKNSSATWDITTIRIVQTPVYFPYDYGTPELNDDRYVFQENKGQLLNTNQTAVSSNEIAFYNQGHSPSTYFGTGKISYLLIDNDTILDTLARVDLSITNANPYAEIFQYEPVDGLKHYFTTSAQGITDVKSYRKLFVPEIIHNVDLHHYSNTSGLKSYFVFKAPESLSTLRIKVDGANSTNVDGSGNLIATSALGNINIGALTAYQASYNSSNPNTPVLTPLTVSWNNQGNGYYGFTVSGQAPFWPVVVYISKPGATSSAAPSSIGNLQWSTYIGDVGTEQMNGSRVDAKDNYYIVGKSESLFYPTTFGAYQGNPSSAPAGTQFGYLSKFNSSGHLDYSTYYGATGAMSCGGANTQINDIAIDSLYNIWLVGFTSASNLPTHSVSTVGSFIYSTNAGGNCTDGFIAKLNPAGNVLRYGTYWGGTSTDNFLSIRYTNGQIYLAGTCTSTDMPLVGPQPGTYYQQTGNGVYLHLDTACVLIHNTKLSNSVLGGDIDKYGSYYTIANTGAYGLTTVMGPTGGHIQSICNGVDWTLQRFNSVDALTWSTYICGSLTDYVTGICIRDTVMALSGYGTSSDFPFLKAAGDSGDVAPVNSFEIQLMKFNINTGKILWSAYHATPNYEKPNGITLDKDFNLYVTGNVECALTGTQTSCPGSNFRPLSFGGYYLSTSKIGQDAFVMGYNSLNQRIWTTYFGSTSTASSTSWSMDWGSSVVTNNLGKLFVSGYKNVKNNFFPLVKWNSTCYYDSLFADTQVTGSYGPNDGFVAMFDISEFKIVGIDEIEKNVEDKVILLFPNPNIGKFTLRFNTLGDAKTEIKVMNILGQSVYEHSQTMRESNEMNVDLGKLSDGVYFINIIEGNKSQTIKFIIAE